MARELLPAYTIPLFAFFQELKIFVFIKVASAQQHVDLRRAEEF
jgi:hypothetical protein